eukprot:gene2560-2799_t
MKQNPLFVNYSTNDNPFGNNKEESKRRKKVNKKVDVGVIGQTPKQVFSSRTTTAAAAVSDGEGAAPGEAEGQTQYSPERDTLFTAYERPKTSRGKSHPSPDEFYSYVVASPVRSADPSRLVIHETDEDATSSQPSSEDVRKGELSDAYFRGLNMEGVASDRQVALLACWLFGSLMRV